jgi:hypothetical protein
MGALREPARLPADKRALLGKLGFRWLFDRDVFVNVEARKIASYEYVADHHVDDIQDELSQPSPPNGWMVSFNEPPGPGVVEAIVREVTGTDR